MMAAIVFEAEYKDFALCTRRLVRHKAQRPDVFF